MRLELTFYVRTKKVEARTWRIVATFTAQWAAGRGVARAMCAHSLEGARLRGFKAMQCNFVVSTNERASRLWQSFGFEIVGRLPGAFQHPSRGFVDAFVMYRSLE